MVLDSKILTIPNCPVGVVLSGERLGNDYGLVFGQRLCISKMAAFADLNVPYLDDPRATEKLVSKAVQLGFETIAICKTHRLKNESEKGKKKKKEDSDRITPIDWNVFPAIRDMRKKNPRFKFYSRITVQLGEQSQLHQLSSEAVQSFDILAVQPTTEKLFQQACKSLEIDIISLDMGSRLPFYLRFPTVHAAVERGVHFEVNYSTVFKGTTERTQLLATAIDLVVFTKGKNIIVSSGAEHELDFRGPYDLVNLGLLFNFKEEQSKAAITKNCRAVMFHAEARRGTERSIISGELLSTNGDLGVENINKATCSAREGRKDNSQQNKVTESGSNGDEDYEPQDKRAKVA